MTKHAHWGAVNRVVTKAMVNPEARGCSDK